ncbi:MAG: tail fiber domain-containing protein [Bacteroidales bacterium]|nr:tail fiber domain-containing protein [Bacteroidales bacterium]
MKSLKVKHSVNKVVIMMISFIYIAISADINAQNVAITDDDGYTVNAAAMLDVKSVNKGLLVPRVALVSTTDPVSVTKPDGLLVWNTSTSGTYDDPGFYYWSVLNSNWVKVGSSAIDFQNGLTQAGNSVKLGGALTESSTITQGSYSLNFNLSGTGDFNIQDAGTSAFFVRDDGNVGIGTTNPAGRLQVMGETTDDEEPLFEVKNKDGQTVFAVYNNGVRVYVDTASSKGLKGGFAVGGFGASKGITGEYLRITPDTFRIYVDDTGAKGLKGGFAVGGFNPSKGLTNEYLRITPDSVRIYVDNEPGSKGLKGGFAVGGFNANKGYEDAISFMDLTPENYFIGHESGIKTTPGTGDIGKYNSFFGYQSGMENTVGSHNLFMGYQSGYSNIYGTNNVFLGIKAGYENEGIEGDAYKGCHNVFIGWLSGQHNTEGQSNVFLGKQCGWRNDLGSYNVFIGQNTAIHNTDGNYNTFIGAMAGEQISVGSNNVFIGYKAGGQITDGSNLLFIDNSNTDLPLIGGDFAGDEVTINGNLTVTGIFSNPSDIKFKSNIEPLSHVLNKLQLINGVYFDWRKDEYPDMVFSQGRQIGVIAQDLEKVYPELVSTNTKGYKSVDYMKLTAILIEAVKEQQQVINELENENVQFKNEIQKINDLQNQIDRLRNSLELGKQ